MKKIFLTQGRFTIVDDEDYDILSKYKWHALKTKMTFYAARHGKAKEKGKYIYMHREVIKCPLGKEIDHINGDGLNNTRNNLRAVTHSENMQNQTKLRSNNRTGIARVYWCKDTKKWRAGITRNGKRLELGRFINILEAKKSIEKYVFT